MTLKSVVTLKEEGGLGSYHVFRMKKLNRDKKKITVVHSRELYYSSGVVVSKNGHLFSAHLPSPLKIRAWDKGLHISSLLENVAAGGGSERKATEKEGKPTKGFVATLTTAWAIGLDPVEFSEDPYEECFRTSTGDERRKYVFISSHLPFITSGPGMSILLHFELST